MLRLLIVQVWLRFPDNMLASYSPGDRWYLQISWSSMWDWSLTWFLIGEVLCSSLGGWTKEEDVNVKCASYGMNKSQCMTPTTEIVTTKQVPLGMDIRFPGTKIKDIFMVNLNTSGYTQAYIII